MRKALTDDTQIDAALRVFRKVITGLGASQPRVTALTDTTEGVGELVDPAVSGALEGIVNTISDNTKQKVMQAQ